MRDRLTSISRKPSPVFPNCTFPVASEQPDRKVPKENTTSAAFIYFSIFLTVVEYRLAQPAQNEVGKFFQADWCSCDYLGIRDFWDSRRLQCHATNVFSHPSRLQKETLHLKEVPCVGQCLELLGKRRQISQTTKLHILEVRSQDRSCCNIKQMRDRALCCFSSAPDTTASGLSYICSHLLV